MPFILHGQFKSPSNNTFDSCSLLDQCTNSQYQTTTDRKLTRVISAGHTIQLAARAPLSISLEVVLR